ncbi:hypothetical protein TNCT_631891 [Trichonephila clavata]|uniref:Uncharacterized protein n=1 Tax=Trichonephila clavata TaxID=2740835 RepID=A0A8X6L086_TRICU|nr:hypothetical protein TNCT_631891 [Trichonephila clavata]
MFKQSPYILGRWYSGLALRCLCEKCAHTGLYGENATAPGKWSTCQELEIWDLEKGHCTRIGESCDPASPIDQNLGIRNNTSPRSPFCTSRVSQILSIGPEYRLNGPFRPSFVACCLAAWRDRRSRDREAILIFHISPMDKARCTEQQGRENVVETHLQLKRLESVIHSDDSGILLKM